MRHLILILGDQLSLASPALAQFDPALDRLLMIEADSEAQAVWSHKARITLFLSAMRHFAGEVVARGWPIDYVNMDQPGRADFASRLQDALTRHQPQAMKVVEPGELRMQQLIEANCAAASVPLMRIDDTHFLCSRLEFADWARGKKELRMEFFYRVMRKKFAVLMDGKEPLGGSWNFDAENRSAYPKSTKGGKQAGPGLIAPPAAFEPDAITREVMQLVSTRFADHPGELDSFAWPVTREQALEALSVFIAHRLPQFGQYQDAMWTNTPFGWHALLSAALNLHLLDPREVIAQAEEAYRNGSVPLESAEGFIRQILGWREFIHGVYWQDMPGLKEANHYGHTRKLPDWFWNGKTEMACLRDSIGQTLRYGYAHHIQRLMVMGNFALLAELSPQQVGDWYLAIYVDAIEWVELPNTAGMALHACSSRFTSKPYVASGAYINRQSNYCSGCRYDPAVRAGDKACPYTTLYWNFIDKHATALSVNPRTALMTKNLERIGADEIASIRAHATALLENLETI